jgi:hypothetical protein
MTFYLIIAAVISIVVIGFTYTVRRLFSHTKAQAAIIADLQNQLSAFCAGAVGADNRIVKFEQMLNQLKEHQNTIDLGMQSHTSYEHAIRLARKGAGMNQLIDNCNLSDEEAHLINRLHGKENSGFNSEIH